MFSECVVSEEKIFSMFLATDKVERATRESN